MKTNGMYKVVDTETGNYCIYEGDFILNAFEAIKDNAKVEDEYAEDFVDAELFDLYKDDERIWCGMTDPIDKLVDICHPTPVLGKSVRDYLNAAFCWGGDAEIIEMLDSAVRIFLMTNTDEVECFELEGEERESAICKLELKSNGIGNVYSFGAYNQERWYICFEFE